MKKWTTKEINGVTFEFNAVDKVSARTLTRRDIWDCYTRPSQRKENIYRGWADWFITLNSFDFTVSSYNCNFFTMEGYFVDNGIEYYAKITASHNYLYMVE